ncbi:hypothetical protein DFO47_101358 [Arthrobacter sp. AG258]|nr:hypothetical protein DFO47_101358 [Arthrobacter sp. AG258]
MRHSAASVTEFFNVSDGDAIGGNIVIAANGIKNAGTYSGAPLTGARTDDISVYNQRNVRVADNLIDKTVSGGIVVGESHGPVTLATP